MPSARDALTPDSLSLIRTIAEHGSFAAAARHLHLVPSALTYRVRQMEDALDVLLFDRSTRQAQFTPAGAELLREAERLLGDLDAVANRIQRVATGWERQLTIAVDGALSFAPIVDLCEAFYALNPPTRLRIREEFLSGTRLVLTSGRADLAIGVVREPGLPPGMHNHSMGTLPMVYAVAPHHPLAGMPDPLPEAVLREHRAVAVADSVAEGHGLTLGLLQGQTVLTVPNMRAKLQAQLRGLGAGRLPLHIAQPYLERGELIAKSVGRGEQPPDLCYAWMDNPAHGNALAWWLAQLARPTTRAALLGDLELPAVPGKRSARRTPNKTPKTSKSARKN